MLRRIRGAKEFIIQRKGQFFLIAALVIVGLIVGVGVIYNFAHEKGEDRAVYDLSEEIDFETSQIMHQSIYTGGEPDVQIKKLAAFYAQTHPDSDLAIYYGDGTKINVILYEAEDCLESNNQ